MSQQTRDDIFKLIGVKPTDGTKDYALAGMMTKALNKCGEVNGPDFLKAVMSEIGQPYEVGYHKGFNGWQTFRRISPSLYDKVKWGMWKKVYNEASHKVSERREFKTLGTVARETTEELLAKSMKESGIEDMI